MHLHYLFDHRLAEHDHGIAAVAFSHDDLLLATAGYAEDRKLIIWDVSTGHIVTSVTQQPCPTTVLVWAGFVRDIKVMMECSSSSDPLKTPVFMTLYWDQLFQTLSRVRDSAVCSWQIRDETPTDTCCAAPGRIRLCTGRWMHARVTCKVSCFLEPWSSSPGPA